MLKHMANELVENVEDLKDSCMSEIREAIVWGEDPDEFQLELYAKLLRLSRMVNNYITESSKVIDKMNSDMNEITKILNKKEF